MGLFRAFGIRVSQLERYFLNFSLLANSVVGEASAFLQSPYLWFKILIFIQIQNLEMCRYGILMCEFRILVYRFKILKNSRELLMYGFVILMYRFTILIGRF